MRYLIGIDDTDNKDSRGTGFRSRQLGTLIEENNLGVVHTITRHQLFFHPSVPYTSQNSSACLLVSSNNLPELTILCRNFLLEVSAIGSDAGLAIKHYDEVNDLIMNWGHRAKRELLTKDEARNIAKSENVLLEGLTGTKDGIIGSLAALGLRKYGSDGRCIWLEGKEIRNVKGIFTAKELFNKISIDSITDKEGNNISLSDKISTGEWVRPAIINNKVTVIVVRNNNSNDYEWEVATKEYIKSITD